MLVVQVTQERHFFLGVPVDALATVTQLVHQRTKRSEARVGVRVVPLNGDEVGRGLARDQVALAPLPILHIERLAQLGRSVVQQRQGNHVFLDTQVAFGGFGERLGDALVDLPVTARFPGRIGSGGQRVDERVHVGGIQIVLLVPGGRRQNDVGIQTGGGHAEVKGHQQVEFAFRRFVMPFDLFRLGATFVAQILALQAALGTQQVLEHVLVALTGGPQQVGSPDKHIARMVLGRFRILTGKRQGAVFHGLRHIVRHFHSGFFCLSSNTQRVAVELRGRRQPAHALGAHVVVNQATAEFGLVRQRRQDLVDTQLLVTPLARMGVEEGGGVHMPGRTLPVQTKGQGLPAGLRTQFFLAYVVSPTATALADAATHDQHVDQAAVVHVHVVPVVHTGTDDDHGTALGLVGVIGELTGNADHFLGGDAGDLFLPGRGVRLNFVIGSGTVILAQATANAVVGDHQVIDGNHTSFGAVRKLHFAGTQLVLEDVLDFHVFEVIMLDTTEVREGDVHNVIVLLDHGQLQVDVGAFGGLLQVPLALFTPAVANGTIGSRQLTGGFINGDGFPLGVVFFTQPVHQVTGAQEAARNETAVILLFQHDQVRHVGVATHVVGEVLTGVVDVELFQDHVAHGHAQSGVGTLLGVHPLVGQLGDFGVVRSNGDGFGALVTHLGEEVGVRGTGLGYVGAPGNDVAGVVPVGGFRHVGLLTPGLGRGRRQVAVPVVEAHAHAADHGQVTAAGSIGDHGHSGNRREADDAIRAMLLGGVDVGGANQLVDFIPA